MAKNRCQKLFFIIIMLWKIAETVQSCNYLKAWSDPGSDKKGPDPTRSGASKLPEAMHILQKGLGSNPAGCKTMSTISERRLIGYRFTILYCQKKIQTKGSTKKLRNDIHSFGLYLSRRYFPSPLAPMQAGQPCCWQGRKPAHCSPLASLPGSHTHLYTPHTGHAR